MANDFYTHVFNPPQGSANRSRPVISEYILVQQGFDAVQLKTNAALRLPAGFTASDLPTITTADIGKSLTVASLTGFAYTTQATSSQMDAAIAAAASAAASQSAAAASAALVAGAANALQMLLISNGIF